MDESLFRVIASQGGFAVLSALCITLGYRVTQMWVADVKAAGERERQLTERVLSLVESQTVAMTALAARIDALVQEQAGMRQHFHNLRNSMTTVELLAGMLAEGKLRVTGSRD